MISVSLDRCNRLFRLRGPETYEWRMNLGMLGARWNKEAKVWECAMDGPALSEIEASIPCRWERSADVESWLLEQDRLLSEINQLRENGSGLALSAPLEMTTEPYRHQVIGVNWLARMEAGILCDEMGLGKTKQAIDAARQAILGQQAIACILVLCPNSLKWNWREEFAKHWPSSPAVWIGDGPLKDRAQQLRGYGRRQIAILNYEVVDRLSKELMEFSRGGIVICDEAHRLKNGQAGVTRAVASLRPARLWLMTGTPIFNKLEDLWSLMNLVRPGIAGFYFSRFALRYLKVNKFGAVTGYQNLNELRHKFSRIALGRKKADCLDLPEMVQERRDVDLSDEEMKAYKQMRDTMKAWLESEVGEQPTVAQAQQFTTQLIRLRQISDGLVSEGADGKQAWANNPTKICEARQIWEDAGRPPVVIWVQWRPVMLKVWEAFVVNDLTGANRCVMTPAQIHGGVSAKDRPELIARWNEMEHGVLICQMDTAGVGLNLHHAALEIFLDVPWTLGQRRQCADRLHRIGQKQTVVAVDLIARNTVDEKLLRELARDIQVADLTTADAYVMKRSLRKDMMQLVL